MKTQASTCISHNVAPAALAQAVQAVVGAGSVGWMLSESPAAYIACERQRAAQAILQWQLRDGMVLASVPCGAMSSL